MKRKSTLFIVLGIFMTCFIFGHSMQPAVVSDRESGAVLAWLQSILSVFAPTWLSHYLVRKLAHFTEFFLQASCFSLTAVFGKKGIAQRIVPVLFCGLLTACTDELIQGFVAGRSSQVTDVWIDFCGTLFAAGFFLIFFRKKKTNY